MHIHISKQKESYVHLDMHQSFAHCTPRARADLLTFRMSPEAVTEHEVERALNHCLALKHVLDCDVNYAVITDDELLESLPNPDMYEALTLNHDLVLLGWSKKSNVLTLVSNFLQNSSPCEKVFPTQNSIERIGAYIVTREMAKELLVYGYPINMPIDFTLMAVADMLGKRVKIIQSPLHTKQIPFIVDKQCFLFLIGVMFCLGCLIGSIYLS